MGVFAGDQSDQTDQTDLMDHKKTDPKGFEDF
jgi:hypothetical protein